MTGWLLVGMALVALAAILLLVLLTGDQDRDEPVDRYRAMFDDDGRRRR